MRDPYHTLGLPKSASQDDIKRAYRRLVKELHPDLNPGDSIVEQRFKEVSAAYDLLGDKDKRARFDRGEIDANGRQRADGGFHRAYADAQRRAGRRGPFAGMNAQDIFSDLFGRGGGVKTKGADLSYTLTIGFLEAARGTRHRVTMANGRSLDITVPPGTRNGQTLRLKGQGTPGMGGGPAGDALVQVELEPHPHFRRDGDDIHLEVPVTISEAVLGAGIEVPTVDGRVTLRVPSSSNTGRVLRLKGKGAARPDGTRGDQYVSLKIVLPDPADPALARFLEGWKPAKSPDLRRHLLDEDADE